MENSVKINFNFIKYIKKFILDNKIYNKTNATKHNLDDILLYITNILKYNLTYKNLKDFFNVNGSSIFYHFNKFKKLNIFEKIYKILLDKYFKIYKTKNNLKYLSIDSTFICNKLSSDCLGRNKYYLNGKKRCSKLSTIIDVNGIPISSILTNGNISDQKLFFKNIENTFINIEYKHTNNKYKRYFLGDTIYDSKNIRNKINKLGYTDIIPQNKRNIKNLNKLIKMNKKQTKIYGKRMRVENFYCFIFKHKRLCFRYDNYESYNSFLYFSYIKLISNYL